jgi:hypothetical protein
VVLAQEEARLLDHDHIGTEHLLVALLTRDADGIATQVLLSAGITYERARAEVVEIVGRGGEPPSGHIPFTRRAKQVLELSLREALERGDDEIRSEHLLLGMIREGSGVGVQVLVKLGVDLTHLRNQVIGLRGLRGPEPSRAVARGAMSAHAIVRGGPAPSMGRPVPRCSFCGRSEEKLTHVVVAGGVLLCDQCVHDAAEQLDALPDDAPTRVRFRRRDVGLGDKDAAMRAIEQAFDAVIGPQRLPPAESLWAVEGGAEAESLLQQLHEDSQHVPVAVNDVTVERVRFTDQFEAEVTLGFWLAGNPQPMTQPAHAVLRDGTWKVSRATIEQFAAQARPFRRPPT